MQAIWKFQIDDGVAEMPEGAHVLSVGVQDGKIMAWALVDTDAPKEGRLFRIYGTGMLLGPLSTARAYESRFLGTVFSGPFVWHVFEAER